MTWVAAGVAAGSAILGYVGSQQAADAQTSAAKKNKQLAQQQYNNSLMMTEPNRMLGYQAGADLANLYGWATPGYTSAQQLMSGQYAGGGAGGVNGRGVTELAGNDLGKKIDPVANTLVNGIFGSNKGPRYGGQVDPYTGTVTVKGAGGKSGKLSDQLTYYLRTGEVPPERSSDFGKHNDRLLKEIDRLRASGWAWDAEAGKPAGQAATNANGLGPQPAGQPGNMDRFFTSPDYAYTFDQAMRANDRSAAARGGALSGNAITRNTTTGAALGAGQYQNYVNNLFRTMGYTDSANTNAQNAGNTLVANVGNANNAMGDARASGIGNMYGSINNGLNALGGIYGNYLGNKSTGNGLSPVNIYSNYITDSFAPDYNVANAYTPKNPFIGWTG